MFFQNSFITKLFKKYEIKKVFNNYQYCQLKPPKKGDFITFPSRYNILKVYGEIF
jgi:hypothetical protein